MRVIKLGVFAVFVLFGLAVFLSDSIGYPGSATAMGEPIAAPTGVTASDLDYANKIGVHWDTIRGANLYRIFRNTTNNGATASDVGTTVANYFFDSTAVAAQTYFYWVRAENGTSLSSLSVPDQGVRAVGVVDNDGIFVPLNPPTAPAGNTLTAAKAFLGKTLFWDEQLSSTRTVSCGTCHRPAAGGSDPRTGANLPGSRNPGFDAMFGTPDDVFGSPGVPQNVANGSYVLDSTFGLNAQVTGRKSPTYLNAGYSRNGLFWDGRATDAFRDQLTNNILLPDFAALESQSAGPPQSPAEMSHTGRNWTEIAARVESSSPLALASNVPNSLATWINGRTYPQLFLEAFGSPGVTPARISMAIASHERTLFSDKTPLDRAISQIQPLTPAEQNGMEIYFNASCNVCHGGALLANQLFHNIGVRPQIEDRGRGAVTLNSEDDGRFRTPSLRNVELHAPYMHNGRFATLEDVVEFYNRGGDFQDPNFEAGIIRKLNLTTVEKADLVAFLKRPLTDLRVKNELPPFDRPRLYTESNRAPVITGTGRAGTGALTPSIVAISPPIVGNPNFTVSVSRAMGNSPAVLVIDEVDPGVGASIPATGSLTRVMTNTQNIGPGNGWASVSVPIPNLMVVAGRTYFARWYISDVGAANGFSVSQAARFTVFGEAVMTPLVSVSGRVTTPAGLGLRNAIVALTDSFGGRRTATTSSFGIYQIDNIPSGANYTIGVASRRFRFSSQVITPSGSLTNFDFIGLE